MNHGYSPNRRPWLGHGQCISRWGLDRRGFVTRTQQQLHALPEEDLFYFLPHTGQELLVGQLYFGVDESDLEQTQITQVLRGEP